MPAPVYADPFFPAYRLWTAGLSDANSSLLYGFYSGWSEYYRTALRRTVSSASNDDLAELDGSPGDALDGFYSVTPTVPVLPGGGAPPSNNPYPQYATDAEVADALAGKAGRDVAYYSFAEHGGVPDYNGTDGTDNGPALQALIDLANARFVSGRAGAPIIDLGPGSYVLKTPVTLKAPLLRGTHLMSGTKLFWLGAAGATVFTKSPSFGGSSYGVLERVTLTCRPASGALAFDFQNEPACWLDLTGNALDVGLRLREVGFIGGVDAVRVPSVINGHWTHLRFDGLSGYAIKFTTGLEAFLGSFVLDRFTYDNHRATGATNGLPSGGFVHIDDTAGAVNMGTFTFRGGRIEFNSPNTAGPNSVIKLTTGASRCVGLELDNVSVQGVGANTVGSVLYVQATSGSPLWSLTLKNYRNSGVGAFVAGSSLPAAQAVPAWRGNVGLLTIGQGSPNTANSPGDLLTGNHGIHGFAGATQPLWWLRVGAEAHDRVQWRADGTLAFGDGTAAPDTVLSRASTGVLAVNGTPLGSGGGGSPGVYSSTAQATLANSTVETVLQTYTVPAGSLTVGRQYRVVASGTYDAIVNGGTLALYLRLGGLAGANWAAFTWAQSATASAARPWSLTALLTVRTTGAAGTIAGGGQALGGFGNGLPAGSVSSLVPGATVNTTGALDLVLDGKWSTADAGNVLRVEQFAVELVKA